MPFKIKTITTLIAIAILAITGVTFMAQQAQASALTNSYVRLDRMKASTATTIRVVFQTSAVNGTEAKVKLTFSDGTSNTTADNFTVNTTQAVSSGSCAAATGATALPGSITAVGSNTTNAKNITVSTVSDLAVSTKYCFDLTTASSVTNPTAGAYAMKLATQDSGGTDIDTKYLGLRVITDDQVVVTAIVPPTFNFVLNGNTDAFSSNLDPAAITPTGGRTVTITTNAAKGWICWAKSNNVGLTSATASYTIPTTGSIDATPSTLVAGTEGYLLDVDLTTDAGSGGTVTIDPEYNGTSAATGGTLSTAFQPLASANGTANGDVITLVEKSAIAGQTPAGNDYTDTLTVIGAGNF